MSDPSIYAHCATCQDNPRETTGTACPGPLASACRSAVGMDTSQCPAHGGA